MAHLLRHLAPHLPDVRPARLAGGGTGAVAFHIAAYAVPVREPAGRRRYGAAPVRGARAAHDGGAGRRGPLLLSVRMPRMRRTLRRRARHEQARRTPDARSPGRVRGCSRGAALGRSGGMTAASIDRLRHAVAVHAAATAARRVPRTSAELPAIEGVLPGRWRDTEHGPVFLREEWYPLDHRHGGLPLGCGLDAPAEALRHLVGLDAPEPEALSFFDIETTGISGGTGQYIVLAGVGRFERAATGEPLAYRMRQYFLRRPGPRTSDARRSRGRSGRAGGHRHLQRTGVRFAVPRIEADAGPAAVPVRQNAPVRPAPSGAAPLPASDEWLRAGGGRAPAPPH